MLAAIGGDCSHMNGVVLAISQKSQHQAAATFPPVVPTLVTADRSSSSHPPSPLPQAKPAPITPGSISGQMQMVSDRRVPRKHTPFSSIRSRTTNKATRPPDECSSEPCQSHHNSPNCRISPRTVDAIEVSEAEADGSSYPIRTGSPSPTGNSLDSSNKTVPAVFYRTGNAYSCCSLDSSSTNSTTAATNMLHQLLTGVNYDRVREQSELIGPGGHLLQCCPNVQRGGMDYSNQNTLSPSISTSQPLTARSLSPIASRLSSTSASYSPNQTSCSMDDMPVKVNPSPLANVAENSTATNPTLVGNVLHVLDELYKQQQHQQQYSLNGQSSTTASWNSLSSILTPPPMAPNNPPFGQSYWLGSMLAPLLFSTMNGSESAVSPASVAKILPSLLQAYPPPASLLPSATSFPSDGRSASELLPQCRSRSKSDLSGTIRHTQRVKQHHRAPPKHPIGRKPSSGSLLAQLFASKDDIVRSIEQPSTARESVASSEASMVEHVPVTANLDSTVSDDDMQSFVCGEAARSQIFGWLREADLFLADHCRGIAHGTLIASALSPFRSSKLVHPNFSSKSLPAGGKRRQNELDVSGQAQSVARLSSYTADKLWPHLLLIALVEHQFYPEPVPMSSLSSSKPGGASSTASNSEGDDGYDDDEAIRLGIEQWLTTASPSRQSVRNCLLNAIAVLVELDQDMSPKPTSSFCANLARFVTEGSRLGLDKEVCDLLRLCVVTQYAHPTHINMSYSDALARLERHSASPGECYGLLKLLNRLHCFDAGTLKKFFYLSHDLLPKSQQLINRQEQQPLRRDTDNNPLFLSRQPSKAPSVNSPHASTFSSPSNADLSPSNASPNSSATSRPISPSPNCTVNNSDNAPKHLSTSSYPPGSVFKRKLEDSDDGISLDAYSVSQSSTLARNSAGAAARVSSTVSGSGSGQNESGSSMSWRSNPMCVTSRKQSRFLHSDPISAASDGAISRLTSRNSTHSNTGSSIRSRCDTAPSAFRRLSVLAASLNLTQQQNQPPGNHDTG